MKREDSLIKQAKIESIACEDRSWHELIKTNLESEQKLLHQERSCASWADSHCAGAQNLRWGTKEPPPHSLRGNSRPTAVPSRLSKPGGRRRGVSIMAWSSLLEGRSSLSTPNRLHYQSTERSFAPGCQKEGRCLKPMQGHAGST